MRTIRTAENQAAFLEALSTCGNVTEACRVADLARSAVYDWKRDDPDFSAAWEEALSIGEEGLEDEARRRAFEGVDEPVFYLGEKCGAVRRYSDTLLIFLLKGAKPEKYRERQELTGANGAPLVPTIYIPSNGRDGDGA